MLTSSVVSLTDRRPEMTGEQLVASLVPPPHFSQVTLEGYRPDADYPSQATAVEAIRAFVARSAVAKGNLFGRKKGPEAKPGIYLDGGFGVGKTHLLAALWRTMPGRKYYGTFIEYTALVGALGYAGAVTLLRGASFVAIDEFELDDPGDTMVMTRLLGELTESGTRIAATSNTPPNALGEGRFAAVDFLREIHALAARFDILRIDGLDYRRRDVEGHARVLDATGYQEALDAMTGFVGDDDFDSLLRHLAHVHPSRYVKLIDGVSAVGLREVHTLQNQADALRFVAFVDRLYDAQIPVYSTGVRLDQVFGDDMLSGGYRKKYLRALSRLIALTNGAED